MRGIPADIFAKACEHTGIPTQGDYLKWQYGDIGITAASQGTSSDGSGYLTWKYAYRGKRL